MASLELVAGAGLLAFGAGFGGWHWWASAQAGTSTPVGTIMIAALSVLSGLQLLLAFAGYDIATVPWRAIHRRVGRVRGAASARSAQPPLP